MRHNLQSDVSLHTASPVGYRLPATGYRGLAVGNSGRSHPSAGTSLYRALVAYSAPAGRTAWRPVGLYPSPASYLDRAPLACDVI